MNYIFQTIASFFSPPSHQQNSRGARSNATGRPLNQGRNFDLRSNGPISSEERHMTQLECDLQSSVRRARQYEMENPNAARQDTQKKVDHILLRASRRKDDGDGARVPPTKNIGTKRRLNRVWTREGPAPPRGRRRSKSMGTETTGTCRCSVASQSEACGPECVHNDTRSPRRPSIATTITVPGSSVVTPSRSSRSNTRRSTAGIPAAPRSRYSASCEENVERKRKPSRTRTNRKRHSSRVCDVIERVLRG